MLRTLLACAALAVLCSFQGTAVGAEPVRVKHRGTPSPTVSATSTPTADVTPEPTATAVAAAAGLDRELAALRERLATLEASMEGAGRPPGGAGDPPAEPPPVVVPTVVEPPASLDVGPSLALAGVGFLIGFLFGTFYGQRQERNRRMRVRF